MTIKGGCITLWIGHKRFFYDYKIILLRSNRAPWYITVVAFALSTLNEGIKEIEKAGNESEKRLKSLMREQNTENKNSKHKDGLH